MITDYRNLSCLIGKRKRKPAAFISLQTSRVEAKALSLYRDIAYCNV